MLKKALLVFVFGVAPLSVFGASLHIGDYFLKGAERAPDDLYVVGRTATLAGSVDGDAVVLGGRLWSEADISGDAFLAGEDVWLKGPVKDDARLVGATVTLDGTVFDDVVAIGSKVVILPTARIEGSLYIIGGDVEVMGAVLGDVKVLSGTFLLGGEIQGNLELWGKAAFKKPARIGGDFILHRKGKAVSPTNVEITGAVLFDETERSATRSAISTFLGGFFALKALMTLALGFMLFLIVRERTEEVVQEALPNFWVRVFRGLLVCVGMSLATLVLIPSVIGIPIAVVLGSFLLILLVLSTAFAGMLFGAWIEQFVFRRSVFPLTYRPVLLGIVFLSLVSAIPFVGPIVEGMLMLGAIGSMGTLFFRHIRARGHAS